MHKQIGLLYTCTTELKETLKADGYTTLLFGYFFKQRQFFLTFHVVCFPGPQRLSNKESIFKRKNLPQEKRFFFFFFFFVFVFL